MDIESLNLDVPEFKKLYPQHINKENPYPRITRFILFRYSQETELSLPLSTSLGSLSSVGT